MKNLVTAEAGLLTCHTVRFPLNGTK